MCPVRCVTYVSGRSPIKQRRFRYQAKTGVSGLCSVHPPVHPSDGITPAVMPMRLPVFLEHLFFPWNSAMDNIQDFVYA